MRPSEMGKQHPSQILVTQKTESSPALYSVFVRTAMVLASCMAMMACSAPPNTSSDPETSRPQVVNQKIARIASPVATLVNPKVIQQKPIALPNIEPVPSPPNFVIPSSLALKTQPILGITRSEAAILFGPPTLLRHERHSELWYYSFPDCTLHVLFYELASSHERRISHYAVSTTNGALPHSDLCQKIIKTHEMELES